MLRAILEAFGREPDDFDWVRDRPGHDRRYAIDPTKLRRELGWEPAHTDFAEGLAETVAWYRENEAWWRPRQGCHRGKVRIPGSVGPYLGARAVTPPGIMGMSDREGS